MLGMTGQKKSISVALLVVSILCGAVISAASANPPPEPVPRPNAFPNRHGKNKHLETAGFALGMTPSQVSATAEAAGVKIDPKLLAGRSYTMTITKGDETIRLTVTLTHDPLPVKVIAIERASSYNKPEAGPAASSMKTGLAEKYGDVQVDGEEHSGLWAWTYGGDPVPPAQPRTMRCYISHKSGMLTFSAPLDAGWDSCVFVNYNSDANGIVSSWTLTVLDVSAISVMDTEAKRVAEQAKADEEQKRQQQLQQASKRKPDL